MNYKQRFAKLIKWQDIDHTTVSTLYTLSEKSLITAIIFTMITATALYSELGFDIVLWGSMVIILSLIRLYYAHHFKIHPQKYTTESWYKLFVIFALSTGITVSTLGFVLIHSLSDYYQLFVLASLLGLTAGASIFLSSDFRIAIVYISIIILPLVLSLAMQDTPLNMIVPLMLILFFFSQVIMIRESINHRR